MAPFAPYGTVKELITLLDVAHSCGVSVVLDVVYNHLGPDGNYLPAFSDSYFDSERENSWGKAPALEKAAFRRLVLETARYWLQDVGFDGLRIDAGRPRGKPSADVPRHRLIYALQNHDRVGNRALGERLHALCNVSRVEAVTLLLLFLPATPLLFMGQEIATDTPFFRRRDIRGAVWGLSPRRHR